MTKDLRSKTVSRDEILSVFLTLLQGLFMSPCGLMKVLDLKRAAGISKDGRIHIWTLSVKTEVMFTALFEDSL